ncbi:MAG: LemA family protein [Gammaproteobacteria bacterium]|nr:MAG: LemA family protein [Gammaproteobacteria bacterium]
MSSTTWWLLAGISALLFWLVALFNRLVALRHTVRAAWSDIEVQLKRRHDLIPKLVEAVRQYAAYEQATLDQVVSLRNLSAGRTRPAERGEAEHDLEQALHRVIALAEAYPDLKANQGFLDLQQEISTVEQDLQHARRYYNGAVRQYNTRIEQFPDLLVARLFHFTPAEYFQNEED